MTDKNQKKPKTHLFFTWYIGKQFDAMDEFFPLSHLCRIAALTKTSLLEEAKRRKIEVWFKVPEVADVRLFRISDVLLSEIKDELDYLSVLSKDAFGTYGIPISDSHVVLCVGEPIRMDYLLLSFQDLRWHSSSGLCVFMEGVRKEDVEDPSVNGGDAAKSAQYQHYNFMQNDVLLPRVFITCKKDFKIPKGTLTLDEERVQRNDIAEMDLYVEYIDLLKRSYISSLASEMEEFKSYLLRLMDLEDMPFVDFPEKLFYIFVITCRNLGRAKLGQSIERKLVVDELVIVGFGKKLAGDIATLIVNTKSSSGKRAKFKKTAGISEEDQLRSLNIMRLFEAFSVHYKANPDFGANQILISLTTKFDYPDEAARKISPLVAGTDSSESWKGYPLTIS